MAELKPRRRRRYLVAAVAGAFLLLAGAGLGAAGGVQAAEGGYFSTSYHRFSTPTAALKSDEIEVGSDRAHAADPNPDLGEVARVRILVRPADPSVPVFVGIGPKAQVESYLRGTAYDDFTSAELRPFRPRFERIPGAAQAPSPNGRPFWVAASQGTGTRTLTWDKTHGAWSVAVMRLDGRPQRGRHRLDRPEVRLPAPGSGRRPAGGYSPAGVRADRSAQARTRAWAWSTSRGPTTLGDRSNAQATRQRKISTSLAEQLPVTI